MEWMEVVDVIEGNTENFENCIYMWRNKINGKLYVGQTINFVKRTREHKNDSFNENSKRYNYTFHRAIRKYGLENFEVCILEKDLADYDEMNEKETHYIEEYDLLAKNKKGYNLASGGMNSNNFEGKTEEEMNEFKRKLSEKRKGENNPMYGKKRPEVSERMKGKKRPEISERMKGENNPMYGKHHSEVTKEKIGLVHKDKHHTKETKKKISEKNKGENNPQARKVILLNNGEIFDYIKQASEKYGISRQSISACCSGRHKYGGKDENGNKLVWMYYDEYLESLK